MYGEGGADEGLGTEKAGASCEAEGGWSHDVDFDGRSFGSVRRGGLSRGWFGVGLRLHCSGARTVGRAVPGVLRVRWEKVDLEAACVGFGVGASGISNLCEMLT